MCFESHRGEVCCSFNTRAFWEESQVTGQHIDMLSKSLYKLKVVEIESL